MNKRTFDRLRRQHLRKVDDVIPLKHLPKELNKIHLKCNSCSNMFPPDWLRKKANPSIPIKPKFSNPGIVYDGPGRWILTRISQRCPSCGKDVFLDIPHNKMHTKGYLFGDEADRVLDDKFLFTYSLVGADEKLIDELSDALNKLKQSVCPNVSPHTWSFHMKEMWNGRKRCEHEIYSTLDFQNVLRIAENMCDIINNKDVFVYNIAFSISDYNGKKGKKFKRLRDNSYIYLVSQAIDEWTTKNAQPNFVFDSVKSNAKGNFDHGWANKLFKDTQHSILYAFLSKGIEIAPPQFVKPGSDPGLELADFVSFVIARYYFKKWQGEDAEIDPVKLGLVTYVGYGDDDNVYHKHSLGYPWELIGRPTSSNKL